MKLLPRRSLVSSFVTASEVGITGSFNIDTLYPANKLRNNYVIFRHFLVTNKRNQKMTILSRNSNVIKKRNYKEQINNVIVT